MTILVFGFEPFLEFDENPSALIAKHLEGRIVNKEQIVTSILHVDFAVVENEIKSAMDEVRPKLAIGFGLAASRSKFSPEKIAINYRFSDKLDNVGKSMKGAPIDKSSSDGLFTNLPVEGLVDHLQGLGIPASLSTSAGAYLCNNAMYVIVREARKRGFGGGFIHVPCHSEWVAKKNKNFSSLPIDTLFKAAELSLSYCTDHL